MNVASTKNLNLSMAAEPESVAVARRAVGELAEELGMEEPHLGDLKTVVTEATSNVVRHAYPSAVGVFELEVEPIEGELSIVVRDFGRGMPAPIPQDEADQDEPSLRLGLGLISMLSNRCEIRGHARGGTEVLIVMPLRGCRR
jgi:anti-sigma regulatory factor (Ser/Thr protein kinase)